MLTWGGDGPISCAGVVSSSADAHGDLRSIFGSGILACAKFTMIGGGGGRRSMRAVGAGLRGGEVAGEEWGERGGEEGDCCDG